MRDTPQTTTGDLLAKIRSLEEQLAKTRELLNASSRDDDTDRYRALFSATQEGILVVNDEGCYVDVNDAYARLLKSTRDAIIGRHFSEFMPPDRLGEAEAAFENLKADGPGLSEFPLRATDGSLVECEWTVHSHFLPGLSLCSARNIGPRKEAEARLKASEARFRFLTRLDDATRPLTGPEEIAETTVALLGEYLAVSNAACWHFEPDQESFTITAEYRRESAPSVRGAYTLTQFGLALGQSLRGNRPYIVEDAEDEARAQTVLPIHEQLGICADLVVPLHKRGRLAAAMSLHQVAPRKWRQDEVEFLQLVANRFWESIERIRVEVRLRSQTHSFDALLSNLPDLICTFDLNGRFTYANPALLKVWQRSLEEIVGKNTFDLGYPPQLAERIQTEVRSVITSRISVRNHTPFAGADGETRIYEYIFSPVLGGDDLLEAVTCTARDITEREQMEKEVAAGRERLEQLMAQAPVAIVVFRGLNLVIELANPFYRNLVHGRALLGRSLAEVLPRAGTGCLRSPS